MITKFGHVIDTKWISFARLVFPYNQYNMISPTVGAFVITDFDWSLIHFKNWFTTVFPLLKCPGRRRFYFFVRSDQRRGANVGNMSEKI